MPLLARTTLASSIQRREHDGGGPFAVGRGQQVVCTFIELDDAVAGLGEPDQILLGVLGRCETQRQSKKSEKRQQQHGCWTRKDERALLGATLAATCLFSPAIFGTRFRRLAQALHVTLDLLTVVGNVPQTAFSLDATSLNAVSCPMLSSCASFCPLPSFRCTSRSNTSASMQTTSE